MTKRLTSEREDVIRESNEQDRWTTEQRQIVVRDLLAELDAVRRERDERESLLRAYETAVGDVNTARDLQAKVAALREVAEAASEVVDYFGDDYVVILQELREALAALDRLKEVTP